MSNVAERAAQYRRLIRKKGKSPAVNGVFVLQKDGIVHTDHNGHPVDPTDQDWNSDEAIEQRNR